MMETAPSHPEDTAGYQCVECSWHVISQGNLPVDEMDAKAREHKRETGHDVRWLFTTPPDGTYQRIEEEIAGRLDADTPQSRRVWTIEDLHESEIASIHGNQYPMIGGKLRIFRENWPNGRILTRRFDTEDPDTLGVRAEIHVAENRYAEATGTAHRKGDADKSDSLLMLAETRAIARALRFFGIGVDSTGTEEIDGKRPTRPGPSGRPQPGPDEAPVRGPSERKDMVWVTVTPTDGRDQLTDGQRARIEDDAGLDWFPEVTAYQGEMTPPAALRLKRDAESLDVPVTVDADQEETTVDYVRLYPASSVEEEAS